MSSLLVAVILTLSLTSLVHTKHIQTKYIPSSYKGPVVGILTQTTDGKMTHYGKSYLAASYVKYAELAGAQVVPILDTWDEDKLSQIFNSINGIIFPGGGQDFPDSTFYKTGSILYSWAIESNKKGKYYPIWGTCLGFEMLLSVAANLPDGSNLFFECSCHMADNLTLLEGAQQSKILENINSDLYLTMQSEKLVFNSHDACIKPDWFTDPSQVLASQYNLLAVNTDINGLSYAAMVEHKEYPLYGTQFHPEKNGFEWTPFLDIPHSQNAINLMQYFANFFVGEARKNKNRFEESEMFYKMNMNNFRTFYTLLSVNSSLQSCYFFNGHEMDSLFSTESDTWTSQFQTILARMF